MTVKLCTHPGCKNVVTHANDGTSPRCTQHPTKEVRKHYDHHFDDAGKNIYKSHRWKKTRKAKLILNPLCEHCIKFGVSTMARIVDHIIEIEDGGSLWEFTNLQALCKAHHNTKTGLVKRTRNKTKKYPSLSNFK